MSKIIAIASNTHTSQVINEDSLKAEKISLGLYFCPTKLKCIIFDGINIKYNNAKLTPSKLYFRVNCKEKPNIIIEFNEENITIDLVSYEITDAESIEILMDSSELTIEQEENQLDFSITNINTSVL